MGRPTKYRDEFVGMIYDYFNRPNKQLVNTVDRRGNEIEIERGVEFPLLCGFATEIGVDTATLRRWAHDKDDNGNPRREDFCAAYAHAKAFQEKILVTNGLDGGYDKTFAQFVAKNVCNYRDKTEQTIEQNLIVGVHEITSGDTPEEAARKYNNACSNG